MPVDLTKQPPPEPQPAPQPEAPKEPVVLTAREELMQPLKAFAAAVASGSPQLARWIVLGAWNALLSVSQTRSSPNQAAPNGPEEQETPAAPASRGGFGDLVERLVIGALAAAMAVVFGGGVVGAAWHYAAPYRGWVVVGFVVAWCLAAACFAPSSGFEEEDTPGVDHEKVAGEEPQGTDLAGEDGDDAEAKEARWNAVRESLRLFVEQEVAAGHAGYIEGVKGKGASVDHLLAKQQSNGGLPGMERKGMIALLEEVGIPVREQMKFRVLEGAPTGPKWKEKNVPGVHFDDLAKALGRAPRLPAHLVPDNTPGAPPIVGPQSGPESAPILAQIPTSRAAGE